MSDGFDEWHLRAVQPGGDAVAHDKARAGGDQRMSGAPGEPHRLGRFVILGRLGGGGMGVVYSAYDPVLDRRVALKLLRPGRTGDIERMRARLHREAQALARLSHPNVVPVYDVGVLGEDVFIVMEFVVGETLRAWATGRPWPEVLAAYLQAAQGLSAAHAVGLVHRDIKPDNIMVGEDGRVRVLDFGLVRGYEPDIESGEGRPATDVSAAGVAGVSAQMGSLDTLPLAPAGAEPEAGEPEPSAEVPGVNRGHEPLTATEAIIGTPAYMPPEQLRGAGIGPKSDQFSFCAALYEGLHGERFSTTADLARLVNAAHALRYVAPDEPDITFPSPREPPASTQLPAALWPILRRGLAADPAQRWPSMDALIDALSAMLADDDRTLADPRVHRFSWVSHATIGCISTLLLVSVIYTSSGGITAEVFTPRSSLIANLGMLLFGGILVGLARVRWRTATYLRRLLVVFVVFHGGMLLNDVVGLWLERPLYQTMIANLVLQAALFGLASLILARWLAWLLIISLAGLTLCLLIPGRYLEVMAGMGMLMPIVALLSWNRRTRKLGVQTLVSRSDADKNRASRRR